ncbi:MAG: hypothetical protein JSS02_24845 [Planctomycetes bacterium]|nr:hypothetical protein [Planctomycetota bacterium]
MVATQADMLQLLTDLGFAVADQERAIGAPAGIPTTLKVLGIAPLSLMFRFKVHPEGNEAQPVRELLQHVPDERASFSLEDGFAFLTLYDASQMSNSDLRLLLDQVADRIASSNLALPPGCLQCGEVGQEQLLLVEGWPTRVCLPCLEHACRQKQEWESQLNRPTVAATLGLPAMCGLVTVGWIVFWLVMGVLVEKFEIKVVEINEFSALILLALFAGVGFVCGRPLGAAIRESILICRAPVIGSLVLIVAAALVGEIGLVVVQLLWWGGVFDLAFAARVWGQVIANYTSFWVSCKLAFIGATWGFCAHTAQQRKQINLNL